MEESKKPKYINPLTDFGFKRIFGTEANADLLMDFLNCMLPLKNPIVEISYKSVEQVPNVAEDRKVIYDLFCVDSQKKEIIVEMQKSKITYFKDSALFYLTFPIQSQATKGEWNFNLKPIYYLSLLDFLYEPAKEAKVFRDIALKDQFNALFYDKLFLKYIQLPAFTKQEHELVERTDKWLYYLKNIENMQENIPQVFTSDKVFNKVLSVAEIAALKPNEYQDYQVSRMQYLEIHAALETAFEDGIAEGKKDLKQVIKLAEKRFKEAKQEAEEAKQSKRQKKQSMKQKKQSKNC